MKITAQPRVGVSRKIRDLGKRGKEKNPSKKLVNTTQWVKVPPGQSLASRPVEKSTCKPSNGSTELDGTRIQAA